MTLKVDAFSVEGADCGGFGRETVGFEALGTALAARENDRTETAFQCRLLDGTTFDGCKNITTFQPTCTSRTTKQIVITTLEEITSLGGTNSKDENEEGLDPVQPTYEEGMLTQSFMAKSGYGFDQDGKGEMFGIVNLDGAAHPRLFIARTTQR